MDNVCNRRLFSTPSKVEIAEEQKRDLIYSRTWASFYFQRRKMKSWCFINLFWFFYILLQAKCFFKSSKQWNEIPASTKENFLKVVYSIIPFWLISWNWMIITLESQLFCTHFASIIWKENPLLMVKWGIKAIFFTQEWFIFEESWEKTFLYHN